LPAAPDVPRLAELVAHARARGPGETVLGATRLARRESRSALRRWRLARRPLRVTTDELAAALGGDPVELCRGRVLRAMPTVARWEAGLHALGAEPRATLLARAEELVAHRFDLLGSGSVDLGEIDWQLDFKSGRRWPLVHISRVPIAFGDGSDIKVPWELSRCQHFPLLAGAARLTADERYRDEIGRQLESWIDSNPVEFGPNWVIAMEPAIRAANWIAALALVADDAAGEPWFQRALASLLQHGRFVRSHLEGGRVRGNHYVSDVVGLLALSALFAGPEGASWLQWGRVALEAELEQQVLRDGVDYEMSIAYHRFVTEMFVCGTQIVEALAPGTLSADHHERIAQMLAFTRDVTRPDGLAPLVGDVDDGRFLPLGDYGADPRSHLHLFGQAQVAYEPAATSAAYREAGFYVMRSQQLYVLIRCGPTGVAGQGWHAHNDQLSLELALGDQPLLVDPGSYVYTADAEARNLFRSTSFHSTVSVGGAEQNELSTVELFRLRDSTKARCLEWEAGSPGFVFEGVHNGFPAIGGASHRRRIELDGAGQQLLVVDTIVAGSARELLWSFPLAGGRAVADSRGATATIGRAELRLSGDDLEWTVEAGFYSPRYGVKLEVPFVRARRVADEPRVETAITLSARWR
jgi:hypothetical protein